MKVRVIEKSFYGNRINKIGDVIEIKEDKLPSWAESVITENEPVKEDEKTEDEKEQDEAVNVPDKKLEELSKLSEDEIKEKLDSLLNDAIDKGIMIEFGDKSDIQLIIELSDLLKEKK